MKIIKIYNKVNNRKAVTRLTLTLLFFVALISGMSIFIYLKTKSIDTDELFTIDGAKKLLFNEVGEGIKVISKDNPAAEKIKNQIEKITEPSSNDSSPLIAAADEKSPAVKNMNSNSSFTKPEFEIIFHNDDVLTGSISTDKIFITTEHGTVSFKISDILSIAFIKEANPPYDRITTRNGDKVTGSINDKTITFKTKSGDTLSIQLSKVKIINHNL